MVETVDSTAATAATVAATETAAEAEAGLVVESKVDLSIGSYSTRMTMGSEYPRGLCTF